MASLARGDRGADGGEEERAPPSPVAVGLQDTADSADPEDLEDEQDDQDEDVDDDDDDSDDDHHTYDYRRYERMDIDSDIEDFMNVRGTLSTQFNVDEARADPDDPDDDGVNDRFDEKLDILYSRWLFLSRYFQDWFSSADYRNAAGCSYIDVRFDAFDVFLPFTTAQSPASDAYLQRLRDCTELVGYMLRVDPASWWFTKKAASPEFRHFQPSSYDPLELEPKMNFVLHQRWGMQDDQPAAIQRLRFMLLECDRSQNGDHQGTDPAARQFAKNKNRIWEEDTDHKLDGYQIPIGFELRTREPTATDTDSISSEPLRVYLLDAIALIKEIQARSQQETTTFAFRLVDVTVALYTTHASDVVDLLRELKSLGVAVKIRWRHSSRDPRRLEWSHLRERDSVYPALADPRVPRTDNHRHQQTAQQHGHSFLQRSIYSSPALLSAVAASSSLRSLVLDFSAPPSDVSTRVAHAKWLAYALKNARGLQALELNELHVGEQEVNAMEAMMAAKDPARLLLPHHQHESDRITDVDVDVDVDDHRPRFVRLQSSATLTAEGRRPQTLTEMGIPIDWELAVVCVEAGTLQCVVPGHGICSTSESNIVSLRAVNDPPAAEESTAASNQSTVTKLVLSSQKCAAGLIPRLIRLCTDSHALQDLRWSTYNGDTPANTWTEDDLVSDLNEIFTTCPQLRRFSLEETDLSSLAVFTRRFESSNCQLRSLAVLDKPVPTQALVEFFTQLGDRRTRIAKRLQKFVLYCPQQALDRVAVEAALQMLRTNRTLVHLTMCVEQEVLEQYKAQFVAAQDVQVAVRPLAMASKVAFLSVVQYHDAHESTLSALGKLDSSCTALVFQFLSVGGNKRILVFGSEY